VAQGFSKKSSIDIWRDIY